MFYIVENEQQLAHLKNLSKKESYVEIISNNDNFHPKLSHTVAIYIRPLSATKGFIIPINHPEGINVAKDVVSPILSSIETLYVLDKKEALYHFNITGATDLQLVNSMNKYERLDIKQNVDTINRMYNRNRDFDDINKVIPLTKLYERSQSNYEQLLPIMEQEIPKGFSFYNDTATKVFYLAEQSGVVVAPKEYVELFKPRDIKYNVKDNVAYSKYNLYNTTSRPTNAFNSVNFAAIPKTKEHRDVFTPKNDYFVELDFDGYHIRLLSELMDYDLTDESAHIQLAKLYFGKDEISDDEYSAAKQINFQAMYGSIPEEHKDLEFFVKIERYISDLWNTFNQESEINNPYTGKAFTTDLKDMHPQKLMNYLIQSVETSRNIRILKDVLRYLQGKRTSVALYTYDSLLFDFDKTEGKELLNELEAIMSENNKYPVKFKYSKTLFLD